MAARGRVHAHRCGPRSSSSAPTPRARLPRASPRGSSSASSASPAAATTGSRTPARTRPAAAIVLFSDLDCRPDPGYALALVEAFRDPAVAGVAGRSVYDGDGLLSRINSANSFGDLHAGPAAFARAMVVAHNVSVRRDLYERDPWGPFAGRIGGDGYLTALVRGSGRSPRPRPAAARPARGSIPQPAGNRRAPPARHVRAPPLRQRPPALLGRLHPGLRRRAAARPPSASRGPLGAAPGPAPACTCRRSWPSRPPTGGSTSC